MIRIEFSDPMGEDYNNSQPELIKGFIFNEGDDFWQTGCAEATINFFENEKKKSLIYLSGIEEYGFKVEHEYKGDNEDIYSLKHGKQTGEIAVMMNSAGEDGFYFREYLVPKEIAWQAIEYFLQTGERDPSLTWEIAEIPETV